VCPEQEDIQGGENVKPSRSKKRLWWIIPVFLIVVLLALALFRNNIGGTLLKRMLTRQTKGKIILSYDRFSLDFTGNVCLYDPVFRFDSTYLNKDGSVELKTISCDTLLLQSISIPDLLFGKRYIADLVLITKPEITILEHQGTEASEEPGFDPEQLEFLIGEKSDAGIKGKIRINTMRINYGSVKLDDLSEDTEAINSVNFSILIDNFSTLAEDNIESGRVLYTDDISFEIKDVDQMMISGYQLDLGSLLFSTKQNKLSLEKVSLYPETLSDSINQIAFAAGIIHFEDLTIAELSGKEDINLRSIRVRNGYFVTNSNRVHKTSRDVHNEVFQNFVGSFSRFKLDTLGIHNIDLKFLEFLTDTIVHTDNLNIELYGVEIDSNMLDDIYRELVYENMQLTTGKIGYNMDKAGIGISVDSSNYNSEIEEVELFDLFVSSKENDSGKDKIFLSAGRILIDGVSKDPIPYPEKMDIRITVEDTDGYIDLSEELPLGSSQGGNVNILELFDLQGIELINVNLSTRLSETAQLSLKGLNASIEDPVHQKGQGYEPDLSHLNLTFEKISFNEEKSLNFTLGPAEYQNDLFSTGPFSLQLADPEGNLFITGDNLGLDSISLNSLINENKLKVATTQLNGLNFKGNLNIPEADAGQSENSSSTKEINLPFNEIDIRNFNANDIWVHTTLHYRDEDLTVKSSANFEINNLYQQGTIATVEDLININWSIDLIGTSLTGFGHELGMQNLSVDQNSGSIYLDELKVILSDSLRIRNRENTVKHLHLSSFNVEGILFDKLILDNQVKFEAIDLNNLDLETILFANNSAEKKPIDPDSLFSKIADTDYSRISLEDMNLRLRFPSDSANPEIEINDLNFSHSRTRGSSNNFMNDLVFSFGKVAFLDTLKNKFAFIGGGHYDKPSNRLNFSDLTWGDHSLLYSNLFPGWKYESAKLTIDNVFAKNVIPTRLLMQKLELSNANLLVVTELNTDRKPGTRFEMENIRHFGTMMTQLRIDTTVIHDFQLTYKTIGDTADHTILIDSIGLTINNINIDTSLLNSPDPNIINRMSIDFNGRTRISRDSLYEIRSGRLSYNFINDRIAIDSFEILPRYNEDEFFRKAVFQTDRTKMFSKRIVLHDLYLDEYLNDKIIHFGGIEIDSISLEMIRDQKYPREPNDFKKLPLESLLGIDQEFIVDSVIIKDSYVEYSEYSLKSETPGTIFFDRFNVNIKMLPSDPDLLGSNSDMTINMNTYIMGKARMDVNIIFPYRRPGQNFRFGANLETFDLRNLNSMSENLMGIAILRGKGSIEAPYLYADDVNSTGTMIFRYKKLKLNLYNRKKAQMNQGMFSGLARFMINDLLLHSNNPRFARKLRTGQVFFERDPEKSIINYLWKSLLSGMLSTAGINTKEQRQEKRDMRK